MIASTRAELLRLGKWPATWVIIGVWLLLNVFFGYVLDYLTYRDAVSSGDARTAADLLAQLSPAEVPATMTSGLPMFGGALVLTLAALATGSGYGWNTWKTVFTQGPRRHTVLAGTLLALGVLLVVMVVLTVVVDLATAAVVLTVAGQPLAWPGFGAVLAGSGGALLIAGMWAAAGALVGILARSPALAVGLGLVWALVVENLLRGVSGVLGPFEVVTEVLPGTAAGSLAGAIGAAEVSETGGAPGVLTILTGAEAALLLLAYVVGFVTLAGFLLSRRDA
jgi:ABC-type transport system involved in multi-copper enzyme maturation permease subunit